MSATGRAMTGRVMAGFLPAFLAWAAAGCGDRPFAPSPLRAGFPLYVTLPGLAPGEGTILKVDLDDDGLPVTETRAEGLDFPSGLAVGPDQSVYFTENRSNAGGRIRKLAPDAATPEDLVVGLDRPSRLALDSFGRLHVVTSDGVLLVHSPGEVSTLVDGLSGISAAAFDEKDRLYLMGTGVGLMEIRPDGGRSGHDEILTDAEVTTPGGLAIGTASRRYIVDSGLGSTDGRLVEVMPGKSPRVLVSGLVNPVAVALEDLSIPYLVESTPAFRIVRYVATLDATIKIADLPGIPYSLGFTPRFERDSALPGDPVSGADPGL